MALNNRRIRIPPRHLSLGLADPPITIRQATYASATETNHLSLVGRVVSPLRQDLYSLIETLFYEWQIDPTQCHGRIIDHKKFQFVFENERDLEMVLWLGPYTFNGWLVVLKKWEDEQAPDFLESVPMWVKISGIPVRYYCEGTIRGIVKDMGEVMEVECSDEYVDFRYARVRVDVRVDRRICFKKVVRFGDVESKVVSLRYEDIGRKAVWFKFCRDCGDLRHLSKFCTRGWIDVPDFNDRALSPPPPDASLDGSGENSVERGASSDGPADAVQEGHFGDDEEGNVIRVESEVVGTSNEGCKRKFEEEGGDVMEKRVRVSADAMEGLGVILKPRQEE